MDVSDIIRGFNTSFKNSVGDGSWGDTNARDQNIIAMTMEVNHLSDKVTKAVGSTPDKETTNKDHHACPEWRINKKGKTSKYPDSGAPMSWCPHNKYKNDVVNGIYMPKGHNHNDWVAKSTKRQVDWNSNKREGKGADVVSSVNNLTKRKALSKLARSKSSKSALVTKLQLPDRETQEIVNSAMFDASNEDSDVESLKY